MGKIKSTTPHNQDYFSAVASLGVLICLVVTVVAIKLWWFKHRLSFEENFRPNSAANNNNTTTTGIIVPRRSKQQKHKKDKRHSQEIYESVEVHGVFRQKPDNDLEIQPTRELPPVRIRPLMQSKSPFMPVPRRIKRRDQIHSTAFEDLEISTFPANAASTSDLTTLAELNKKLSLTFAEFQKQYKLKDIKSSTFQPHLISNKDAIKIPVPPLRLNRSSSAIVKPAKPQQHILQSSQSIVVPDLHKVTEKRSIDFSRPKDDLTKIDDLEEIKFETFGERRPTGYIKYEEVDTDLQEHYGNELNARAVNEETHFTTRDYYEPSKPVQAPQNLTTETSDAELVADYDFNRKFYNPELEEVKSKSFQELDTAASNKFQSVEVRKTAEFLKYAKSTDAEDGTGGTVGTPEMPKEFTAEKSNNKYDSVKERIAAQAVKECQTNKVEGDVVESASVKQTKTANFESENFKSKGPDPSVKSEYDNKHSEEEMVYMISRDGDACSLDCYSWQKDSWPQFNEKIETPKVNFRKLNNQDLDTQSSIAESDDFSVINVGKETATQSNLGETLNQRRPPAAGFVRDWSEPTELKDIKEWQESFNKKFYNQVRSSMASDIENSEAPLNSSVSENGDHQNNAALKEKIRPTEFVRRAEYDLTYNYVNSGNADDNKQGSLSSHQKNWTQNYRSNREMGEMKYKLKFEDGEFPTSSESKTEKYTLNQRRPTEFVKPEIDAKDCSAQNSKENFEEFDKILDNENGQQIWGSDINERRLTVNGCKEENSHNSTTIRYEEVDKSSGDADINTESPLKQRRLTGFIKEEDLDQLEKKGNLQLNNAENKMPSKQSETLRQGEPTGIIKKEEITKQKNIHLNKNSNEDEREPLKQKSFPDLRGRKESLKNNDFKTDFDDSLCQEMAKNVEHDSTSVFEEEFAKIRHSNELNEADFLEIKDNLQKSAINCGQQLDGFGKSIEDDWDNFEKLKTQCSIRAVKSPQEIHIISNAELPVTASILKEQTSYEDASSKPRKSKVTFDFKNDEYIIPISREHNYLEGDTDGDDDVESKSPPPIPPQPMQRLTNVKYNNATSPPLIISTPTKISLFGSQITERDNDVEDSWAAIRKHRNLAMEFQADLKDRKSKETLIDLNATSKPIYRNPMAQLAVQLAQVVGDNVNGFKSRSITDKRLERCSNRENGKFFNFTNDNHEETEA